MGIHKLFQLLDSRAGDCIREIPLDIYTSKTIAYDASTVSLLNEKMDQGIGGVCYSLISSFYLVLVALLLLKMLLD